MCSFEILSNKEYLVQHFNDVVLLASYNNMLVSINYDNLRGKFVIHGVPSSDLIDIRELKVINENCDLELLNSNTELVFKYTSNKEDHWGYTIALMRLFDKLGMSI